MKIAPKHYIVWRDTTRPTTSVTHLEPHELDKWISQVPEDLNGAACVIASSADDAENIALEDCFWHPVDLESERARFMQTNTPRAAHYPEAW